ncbi:MAG: 50S ribosomal protein L21, partial [Candidatus Korobacteraceae bacterium]
MYAVIRAGGKQYRVAPGDVIEIEKLSQAGGENVQFDEVLAVSGSEG